MKYVIGLGNPGKEYEETRHNIGFRILDMLRKEYNFPDWKLNKYIKAHESVGSIGGYSYTFILPDTFMNKSGLTVSLLLKKVPISEIIVVYDDLAFFLGEIKISHQTSAGGHNGIDSIITSIGTKEFLRLRLGILSKTTEGEPILVSGEERANFVLKNFRPDEVPLLPDISKKVLQALVLISKEGKEKAMTLMNA